MAQCANDATTAGFVLLRATTEAATAYNKVAKIRNSGVAAINPSAETKETTDSEDEWKTYRRGLKDGGEFAPTLDFKPDDPGHLLMQGDWKSRVCPWPYALVNKNTGKGWKFQAIITSWGTTITFSENEVTRNVSFKLSGEASEINGVPTIEDIVPAAAPVVAEPEA